MSLVIGRTFSHYRIISTLGEGGMGVVYLAEDTHLYRKVAIKIPTCAPDQQLTLRRFIGEARHASRLTHPRIAAIYDYGETNDGCPFIVMELVSGESLSDVIARGRIAPDKAIGIAIQVAEALEEAHAYGIMHRDIKPSNIRFAKRDQIKVLDFGLAKRFDDDSHLASDPDRPTIQTAHTESGMLIGTPLYLSPEQFKGAKADARSDLFALGALLYECVAGRPAFSGANFVEIGAQVIHVEPPPLADFAPETPPELEQIVRRLLAKDPAMRYQSAGDVIADLQQLHTPDSSPRADDSARTRLYGSHEYPQPTLSPNAKPTAKHGSDLATVLATNSPATPGRDTLRGRTLDMFQRTWQRRLPASHAIGLAVGAAAFALLLAWVVLFAWRGTAAPHAPSPEAARLYDAGVALLRDGAPYGASKALQRVTEIDSQFALAHARLAEAWTELDYADRASDALLRANSLVPDRSALPRREALRLEAVIATAMRDYDRAVASYKEIARLEPSDAGVYVDIGRAYEKAEDAKAALDAYTEATRRNSQYATAYLRQAALYGRAQNTDAALASFARAAELYEILSNTEGRTEVFYHRGAMFDRAGRIADARGEFQQALELARFSTNQYQQISALLGLSGVSYSQGDTVRAAEQASEAIRLAQTNGMETLTARGLLDLGNISLVRGDYRGAETHFRQALAFAEEARARYLVARATFMLGSLRYSQGRAEDALPLVESALAFFQPGGYRKETSQALTLKGRVMRQQGNYAAALQAFEQQLRLAMRVGDLEQQALARESIGITFSQQDKYVEALSHFDEGFALDRATGNQLSIGYSLVNRGSMLWRLGRYDEAEALLEQAAGIAKQPSSDYKVLSGNIHLAEAYMALSRRRFDKASAEAKQVIALNEGEQSDVLVEAKSIYGLARTYSGAARAGVEQCEEALKMASRTGDSQMSAVALLSLAEALLMAGDAAGASERALRAQEQFARTGQQDSEWRAWHIAARAENLKSDEEMRRRYDAQAAAVLDAMRQRWQPEAFTTYLARPDIQFYRSQLDDHLAGNSR